MKLFNILLSVLESDPKRKAIRKAGINPDRFYAVRDAAEQVYQRRWEKEWPEREREINKIVESWPED
jgi:hypothetical protein